MASRILAPRFHSPQSMAYKKSYRNSKKKYASKGKRSEYAKAAKQMDGSRFVIMTQYTDNLTMAQGASCGTIIPCNALYRLTDADMFTQVCAMYDEFRIKSMKVKICPMQTTMLPSGQIQINTAWDRNGQYLCQYWDQAGNMGYKLEQTAPQITTYSSYSSKPLLQY